jgi:hypothetical protein
VLDAVAEWQRPDRLTALGAAPEAVPDRGRLARRVLVVALARNDRERGAIQKKLDADKLVLIRDKVFRNGNPIKDGIFVTTQKEVLLRDFWGPRLDRLRKLASAREDDFEMVKERVPELEGSMRAVIEAALAAESEVLELVNLGMTELEVRLAWVQTHTAPVSRTASTSR